MIHLKSLGLEFKISPDSKNCELLILDQTLLPNKEKWLMIDSTEKMIEAIQALRVRGAPLIGVAAVLSLAQSASQGLSTEELRKKSKALYQARPTAVNLMNCLDRMNLSSRDSVIQGAVQIFQQDVELCEKMGLNGAALIADGDQILTHCNTGGLATAGIGTALGVIRKAHEQGKKIHVFVDETRPLLQGGRLTAWELQKLGVPMTLITDNMAAHLMSQKKITKAFVGSDRIAANGDFANKIGTYSVAVNCRYHNIPFYVVAPSTTVDPKCSDGSQIHIELRKPEEVTGVNGSFGNVQWAPQGVNVYNPAFDVTPATLTTGWVLETGVYNQQEVVKCLV